MAEKVHFLPVDLQVHRSQVFDLMVEYGEWVAKEAKEHFKIDILAAARNSSMREYVASNIDKFVSEVSSQGIFYLVELESVMIGMGALHQIREKTGAIKRVYIRLEYRGKGYGKILLQQLLEKAKEFGYHAIYLDSARFKTAAHQLYCSVGFIERNEYPEVEVPPQFRSKWVFMEKILEGATK
jgi:GNAT superfamily N-acetyltransferase